MPRVRFPAMEFFLEGKRQKEQDREGKKESIEGKRGGAVVARQAHNLQVG